MSKLVPGNRNRPHLHPGKTLHLDTLVCRAQTPIVSIEPPRTKVDVTFDRVRNQALQGPGQIQSEKVYFGDEKGEKK
jgi:hypothetical protein